MLTPQQQQAVWSQTPAELSNEATMTWQTMVDYDGEYSEDSAAAAISQQMGGSLSEAEVQASLIELNNKGLLAYVAFKAAPLPGSSARF